MVEIKVQGNSNHPIFLGHQGEHQAREIIFDVSEMAEIYGEGTAQLLHQRREDSDPYLCAVVQDKNNIVRWPLTAADTAMRGEGQAELRWYVDETVAKSAIYKTITLPGLGEAQEETPEPWKGWVDQVIEAVQSGGATPEQISAAVERYLMEHPIVAVVG